MAVDSKQILTELDAEQLAVVTAIRGPVCVIAGAGTGKTRVITNRIAYAINSGVTDPTKVLALTFTARAAGEMRARLRALGVPNVSARTFHSAAIKQLLYFWPYAFGGQFPTLLTTKSGFVSQAIERAEVAVPAQAAVLREIAGEIEWAKVLEISPENYHEKAIESNRLVKLPNNKSASENLGMISQVYEAYESLKRQERTLDFEDVLLLTVGMLEEDRGVRERIRDQYRYFTVDEYQDVSPLQQRLLNLWLGNREEICVVGDAAQTIYSFAGATSNFLLNFKNRFPNAQVFRLSTGYRSTPEIINTANQILRVANLVSDHGIELQSVNTHGEKPLVNGFSSAADEIAYVATEVKKQIDSGIDSSDIAILARTNAQLDQVKSALNNLRVASQIRSGERFFERVDVRDAMRLIRGASVLPSEGGDWFADLVSVLQPFGDADYVTAFLRLARSIKDNGGENMRAFLREIEDRAEQNNPPILPGVTLSTLHGAKGLEWDHLYLIGISEGVLPMGNDLNEERRLFYVGVTRAKQRIHITYAGKPSVFLEQFN
ncbi:MAG: DNA/RNA helicase [Actinobacteria bacterium BACL4 MAG-120507-bin0]|jgi:DNA helicase II / ATP-dependent DNA helicase PcrA|uniref:ATP-dependent helicase n=1 Tax=Candidatus Nanopelagicus sp. TaxID=2518620 RepID=UPI00071421EC|nr:MAG: DNA/RNA helicase [Actinobacteria bacterium BACL4 MAG-120813-bin39]KRO76820.1 MAG: DNA/RNA helicase [Actinobacteria bacterium BACL4 MAG-120920-bin74]KRO92503.1 MAG: DNA/RNA helicase [Actinobacteria bacterium BACL4 MAG-120507-bin0]